MGGNTSGNVTIVSINGLVFVDLNAQKIVKAIKSSKSKVQTSIQGDEVRVSGKKRDDLQAAIKLIKELNIKLPLQYENFRD